jgi:hypothetical protein
MRSRRNGWRDDRIRVSWPERRAIAMATERKPAIGRSYVANSMAKL